MCVCLNVESLLSAGFGRQYVQGRSSWEAGWLIEASHATQAERMCAMSPLEGERWVRLAEIEVSPRVEQGLRDHQVLVLARRVARGGFGVVTPEAVNLADLSPESAEDLVPEITDFIEVQVVDARGKSRPSVRYVLQFPDGTEVRGTTGVDGMLRHEKLGQQGDSMLFLPDIEPGEAA